MPVREALSDNPRYSPPRFILTVNVRDDSPRGCPLYCVRNLRLLQTSDTDPWLNSTHLYIGLISTYNTIGLRIYTKVIGCDREDGLETSRVGMNASSASLFTVTGLFTGCNDIVYSPMSHGLTAWTSVAGAWSMEFVTEGDRGTEGEGWTVYCHDSKILKIAAIQLTSFAR